MYVLGFGNICVQDGYATVTSNSGQQIAVQFHHLFAKSMWGQLVSWTTIW